MADQGQKTITIDELVSELSKTPSVPPASLPKQSNPPSMAATSAPSQPLSTVSSAQPIQQPPKPMMPAQSLPAVPRPASPSVSATPPQLSATPAPVVRPPVQPQPTPTTQSPHSVREYQSSIRTMASDITSMKSGQQPSGVSMPRKIDDKPLQPAPIQPMTVAPGATQQNVPWAKIEMGQLEKGAQINNPTPKPIIGQAQNRPISPPPVIIPEQKAGINRNILFAGIAGIAVIASIGYWFFVLRSPDQIVVVTPTPTASATPTPTPTLKSILVSDPLLIGVASSGNPLSVLLDAIKSSTIVARKVQAVEAEIVTGTTSTVLKSDELLSRLAVVYPSIMKPVFGEQDSHIYSYGQTESFNTKGVLTPNTLPSYRLVIVSEVKDSAVTLASLRAWETTMANDFNSLFELNYKKGTTVTFQDNAYKGSPIRYVNFPWPDKSIDYAIVRASNGKQYLVITNSRESIYSTLDKLVIK